MFKSGNFHTHNNSLCSGKFRGLGVYSPLIATSRNTKSLMYWYKNALKYITSCIKFLILLFALSFTHHTPFFICIMHFISSLEIVHQICAFNLQFDSSKIKQPIASRVLQVHSCHFYASQNITAYTFQGTALTTPYASFLYMFYYIHF